MSCHLQVLLFACVGISFSAFEALVDAINSGNEEQIIQLTSKSFDSVDNDTFNESKRQRFTRTLVSTLRDAETKALKKTICINRVRLTAVPHNMQTKL